MVDAVRAILAEAPVVIAHSDYAHHVLHRRRLGGRRVLERDHLEEMRKAGASVEILTVGGDFRFGELVDDPLQVMRAIELVKEDVAEGEGFTIATSYGEVRAARDAGDVAILLNIEGSSILGEEVYLLRALFHLGLRALGLTWNGRNQLADGCMVLKAGGLTEAGVRVVKEAQRLGIVVDVSHLAEPGFYDMLEIADRPVIASHSNCRALEDHPRNLTDEQLRRLSEAGGVMGINFYAEFVGSLEFSALLDHVDHAVKVAGVEHVGLGPDQLYYAPDLLEEWRAMDKAAGKVISPLRDRFVEGLERPGGMPLLVEGLLSRGYSQEEVEAILGGNFLRVFRETLP
jgi:membrane dipeptidase